MNIDLKRSRIRRTRTSGVSLLELLVALAVILILASIVIPNFNTAVHTFRLKGGISDFSGIVQVSRIRAVDDDRYYSVYIVALNGNNTQEGFVDIYPQNINGASGSNGAVVDPRDPVIQVNVEVNQRPQAAAPNTANLKAQILPATSPVVPLDGSAAATPVTFGPRGLPCTPTLTVGGTVCDTLGGPTAYWTFFQNNVTQRWGAVTITPAGRIQRWLYGGGAVANTWYSY